MTQWCHAVSDDSLSTVYSHGLNTDHWGAALHFQSRLTPRVFVQVHETAGASRLKVTPTLNKWKDQHSLLAESSISFRPDLSLQIMGSHYTFIDKQSGTENNIHTQMLGMGLTYTHKNFSTPVLMGIKQDKRLQQSDIGFSYNIQMQVPRTQFGDYTHQFLGQLDGDILDRRKNHSRSIQYQVHRRFYQDTADTLNLEYRDLRRDYYISREGALESREDISQSAENRLTYQIGTKTYLYFLGRIALHQLKISQVTGQATGLQRERNDIEMLGSFRLCWQYTWMRGNFQFRHLAEDQNYKLTESLPATPYQGSHLLRTPDNQSSITSYLLKTQFPLGHTDTLSMTTQFQKFQYDTPDDDNFDDRDELRWHLNITHQHRFSSRLSMQTHLSTHMLHLVYIFGEKSADNNWTRIFRLNPELVWKPTSAIRWKQSVSVLANYVDYDFDTELTGIRSFLYRKYQLEDSLYIGCTARAFALINYRLEMDENGKLIWNRWLEEKLIDRQSHTFSIQMDYVLRPGLHIRPGYTYYIRTGYRYISLPDDTQERKTHLNFQSHGPLLKWVYHGRRIKLNFSAHTIRTKTLTVKRQIYTRLDFQMNWIL